LKRILISAAVLLTACAAAAATDDGSMARAQPKPKGKGRTQWDDFRGVVTAVSRSEITIRGTEGRGDAERVRVFPIVPGLTNATKMPPGGLMDDTIYLPTDVKVGDMVRIRFVGDGVVTACERITIWRRPGGRVPPGYCTGQTIRHHEQMNAYQDLEEKGIPLPEKYDTEAQMKRVLVAPSVGKPN
jgi:hypothetical protein